MTNNEKTTIGTWRDENLLIVYAEGYAHRHSMIKREVLKFFREYGVTEAIRQCYSNLTKDYLLCLFLLEVNSVSRVAPPANTAISRNGFETVPR
jgi:hypothetical protein